MTGSRDVGKKANSHMLQRRTRKVGSHELALAEEVAMYFDDTAGTYS